MRLAARLVLLTVPAGCWLVAANDSAGPKTLPPASEIIAKAVAWAKWHREQKFYTQWSFDHVNRVHHLDDAELVQSHDTRGYRGYPLRGEQFYEWVLNNGEPLSPSDLSNERKRREKFIAQAVKKAAGEAGEEDGEDEPDFAFNEELVSRYRSEVVGTEEIDGRTAYVLQFVPKNESLPVRRRMDHALNKSRGRLWIDTGEFVVLRVEFELLEPVKLWAGLLGSISRLSGYLALTELGGGAWHYKEAEFRLKGRVLIKSFHEDRRLEWMNFQPAGEHAPQLDSQ